MKISCGTIQAIFKSLIQFQIAISNQCRRSYKAFTPTIETILKQELEDDFTYLLVQQWPNSKEQELRVGAIMMSWAMYGTSMHYMKNADGRSEDEYIEQIMPFI